MGFHDKYEGSLNIFLMAHMIRTLFNQIFRVHTLLSFRPSSSARAVYTVDRMYLEGFLTNPLHSSADTVVAGGV